MNVVCQEHRSKMYLAMTKHIETECHYQPLTDISLILLLREDSIYSNTYMVGRVREQYNIPSAPNRKRKYGEG